MSAVPLPRSKRPKGPFRNGDAANTGRTDSTRGGKRGWFIPPKPEPNPDPGQPAEIHLPGYNRRTGEPRQKPSRPAVRADRSGAVPPLAVQSGESPFWKMRRHRDGTGRPPKEIGFLNERSGMRNDHTPEARPNREVFGEPNNPEGKPVIGERNAHSRHRPPGSKDAEIGRPQDAHYPRKVDPTPSPSPTPSTNLDSGI